MDWLREELDGIEQAGLLRRLKVLETHQGPRVKIAGLSLINLSSNDYLGLCNDKRLKAAAISAVNKYGVGCGASRLVCGTSVLHEKLEKKLADFKKAQSALVFNSGYCANLSAISALFGKDDIVFSDRLNHASLIDAIILSRAQLKRYPHNDTQCLEKFLKGASSFRRRLIVTDTVFSMDGDIAPIPEILSIARKYNALVFLDEAHATGVLGKNGRGALEHFGIGGHSGIIQMGTLSKALGSFGAYICGPKEMTDYFINKARAFIYTTALPVSLCAAAICALDIIKNEPRLRLKLEENIKLFRDGLASLGFKMPDLGTPIIPLIIGENNKTLEFSRRLFAEGVLAQAIRPPTVPIGQARIRFGISAAHSKKDLEFALEKIAKVSKQLGVLF